MILPKPTRKWHQNAAWTKQALTKSGVTPSRLQQLTPRQADVLRLVWAGDKDVAIADKLKVSRSAVRRTLARLAAKLRCANTRVTVCGAAFAQCGPDCLTQKDTLRDSHARGTISGSEK